MKYQDTIVAISTPSGTGAIAIIRCSGPDSLRITDSLFRRHGSNKPLVAALPNQALYGYIMMEDEMVDEVITTVYKAPHSYTGEDVAEISCHGSIFIQEQIILLFLSKGCRLAERGEFTLRAFLNGKMDLARAEGVADLIASTNKYQHLLSMKQMRGRISDKLTEMRSRLVEFASLLELELDFSQEDVEFADRKSLMDFLSQLHGETERLASTFRAGNALKKGIPVAIAGKPNAGKSTLLNALLEEEKAIVSEVPGTTRDAIEDTIHISEIPFRFIDTAGLRSESDTVEAMGIEKSWEKMARASVILYVFDATSTSPEQLREELGTALKRVEFLHPDAGMEHKRIIAIGNKTDQLQSPLPSFADCSDYEIVFVSAKKHENISSLKEVLLQSANVQILQEELIITGIRHYEALQHSASAIADALMALKNQIPSDLVATDIRQALYHLGLITGEVSNDELLHTIFSRFCIGK